ncbi:MAG: hypothetical protein K8R59_07110 [Thermoanaerobaculales bacterium]|nr:hypothetical protein [Thermoanaerobaculales bacterium]
MTALREKGIEISLPSGVRGRKFDDASHGLSHCMKAVDFIIELNDRILFVEIKDPEHSGVAKESREDFVRRFQVGEIDRDLARKYRDTFLYEWAAERLGKPVHYLVLVAISALDAAMLLARTDALKRELPFDGPSSGTWTRRFADGCMVFNLAAWNEYMTEFRVRRS